MRAGTVAQKENGTIKLCVELPSTTHGAYHPNNVFPFCNLQPKSNFKVLPTALFHSPARALAQCWILPFALAAALECGRNLPAGLRHGCPHGCTVSINTHLHFIRRTRPAHAVIVATVVAYPLPSWFSAHL